MPLSQFIIGELHRSSHRKCSKQNSQGNTFARVLGALGQVFNGEFPGLQEIFLRWGEGGAE